MLKSQNSAKRETSKSIASSVVPIHFTSGSVSHKNSYFYSFLCGTKKSVFLKLKTNRSVFSPPNFSPFLNKRQPIQFLLLKCFSSKCRRSFHIRAQRAAHSLFYGCVIFRGVYTLFLPPCRQAVGLFLMFCHKLMLHCVVMYIHCFVSVRCTCRINSQKWDCWVKG